MFLIRSELEEASHVPTLHS